MTGKHQAQAEEGTGTTQQYVTSKQEDEESEEAIRVENRISNDVATPPVMSPQSVTSQECSVIFEERAL